MRRIPVFHRPAIPGVVLLAAVFVVLAAACSSKRGAAPVERQASVRAATPVVEESGAPRDFPSAPSVQEVYRPRVPLDSADAAVGVYNVNLDLETSEEQVLLLKRNRDAGAPVRVAVVVYDPLVEGYLVSFEAETLATNTRSVELSFIDMVGDHSLEIVCRGMDAQGRQTMNIYRKAASPRGFGLYFESIFAIAVDGTIEIEQVERSEAYRGGFANGESFTVKTLRTPEDSRNLLDLIENRYFWRFADRKYVMGREERIPGEAVEQAQLRDLYRSGATAFETFLHGAWFLEQGEPEGQAYLYFEPLSKQFTFYAGDVQEVYEWSATYKILVNQVELAGINELIPYIRKNLYVQVTGIDTIRLLGSDPWRGSYRRIRETALLRESDLVDDAGVAIELRGSYLSDVGERLVFRGNEFELEEAGVTLRGFFSIYSVGVPILELKIRERSGVIVESRRYRMTYEEESRDNRVYRTILLEPGVIGVYGFEATGDGYTRYEQIEQIDSSQ